MNAETFIEIIETAGYEARSYSGRGMYGRSCVGISLDRGESAFTAGARLAHACDSNDDAEEIAELSPSSDSLGLGSILYFQEFVWPESQTNDNDEDDDLPNDVA